MMGFVALGALSIGFAYLPVVLLLDLSATLGLRGRGRRAFASVLVAAVAALAQVAVMLALIRILYPGAMF